jgi:hypothetical protein
MPAFWSPAELLNNVESICPKAGVLSSLKGGRKSFRNSTGWSGLRHLIEVRVDVWRWLCHCAAGRRVLLK